MREFRENYLLRLVNALDCARNSTGWNEIGLSERRRKIKTAADTCLALTCKGSVWSRALFTDISRHTSNKNLVRKIAGSKHMKYTISPRHSWVARSSSAVKKTGLRRLRAKRIKSIPASAIARKMVKDRTRMLQRLVPGGKSMGGSRLITEAADYIISLQAQVQVMHFLINADGIN